MCVQVLVVLSVAIGNETSTNFVSSKTKKKKKLTKRAHTQLNIRKSSWYINYAKYLLTFTLFSSNILQTRGDT